MQQVAMTLHVTLVMQQVAHSKLLTQQVAMTL